MSARFTFDMEDLCWLAGGGTLEVMVGPSDVSPLGCRVLIAMEKKLARDSYAFRNAGAWGDCPPFQTDRPELGPKPLGVVCEEMDDGKHCCEQCEEWKPESEMSPVSSISGLCQACWKEEQK